MNCNFCGETLDSGRHPRNENGMYDVTSCQAGFLLRKNSELEMRLREIVAWFDVIDSKYHDGQAEKVSADWPIYWLQETRSLLTGDSNNGK